MYNFKQHLEEGERILYQGKPVPGMVSKNVGGLSFIIVFMLVIQVLMVWSVITGSGDGANGINIDFIIIFLVTLLFEGIAIYGLIYNLFLKKKSVIDDYYCITNKRILKYEERKQELVCGNLAYYENISCSSEKGNYGDLTMSFFKDDDEDEELTRENIGEVLEMALHPDPNNMPSITFLSIENPRKVYEIAMNARMDLLSNKREDNKEK